MSDFDFISKLFLSVKRSGLTRVDDPFSDEANAEFIQQKPKFLEQVTHTFGVGNLPCECCGFSSASFQHVHHKDGDHRNNVTSNFSLRCPLCHYVEHIGYERVAENAVIIMLPEMSQELLNCTLIHGFSLNHILENNMTEDNPDYNSTLVMATQFQALYSALHERKLKTKQFFGSYHPNFFANCLLDMSDADYEKRSTSAFKDLKILFHPELFATEIPYWSNTVFGQTGENPNKWVQLGIKTKERTK